jgi:PAS domain S-box-containing protein
MNFLTVSLNLLQNATAMLGVMFLYNVVAARWLQDQSPRKRQFVQGLCFGALAILSMTAPVVIESGVFFDLRGVIMALAAAYYGVIPGGVATIMVMVARLIIGGAGVIPAFGITLTTFVIAIGFYLFVARRRPLALWEYGLLGVLISVQIYGWSFLLPVEVGAQFRDYAFLPMVIIQALAVPTFGLMLAYQERYLHMSEVLERERDLLRGLIEAVPDYIFAKDRQGRFILSNTAHAQAARMNSTDDLIGKATEKVFAPELAAQYRADDEAAMRSPEAIQVERQTVDAHGKPIWVATIKAPLRNRHGQVTGVIGISRDITARKLAEDALRQSEALYRQIIETAHEGMWIVDPDGRIALANPRLGEIVGYEEAELLGKLLSELTLPEDELTKQAYLERRRRGLSDQYDFRLRHKDGSLVWVIISASPLINERGDYQGSLAMITDITDRKRAEAQALELAAERERMRGLREFIVSISHDFRTPLSILSTSTYLLRKLTDPTKIADRLNLMDEQVKRLAALLEGFIELMNIAGQESPTHLTETSVNALVENVLQTWQTRIEARNQQLTYTPDAAVPNVKVNASDIENAVSRIVENAMRFTPQGGQITIRTLAEGEHVVIEIADTGIGIHPHDQPHIFELFYRADAARSMSTGGSGLGLSLARKIVEMHGGTIQVFSSPDQGSVFRVLLKAAATPLAEPATAPL